jgi:hypothetical protein
LPSEYVFRNQRCLRHNYDVANFAFGAKANLLPTATPGCERLPPCPLQDDHWCVFFSMMPFGVEHSSGLRTWQPKPRDPIYDAERR